MALPGTVGHFFFILSSKMGQTWPEVKAATVTVFTAINDTPIRSDLEKQ